MSTCGHVHILALTPRLDSVTVRKVRVVDPGYGGGAVRVTGCLNMMHRRRLLAFVFSLSGARSFRRSVRRPRPTVTVLVGALSLVISSLAVGVLLPGVAVAASDTISTVAGNGLSGFSGDGGPATAARFQLPTGVAVDSAGNTFIADAVNYRVRRVSPSGVISTIAGTGVPGFSGDGGPATAAQFQLPTGVAVDATGNIYIADSHDMRIRRVSPSGIISTFAGTGVAGFSGDGGPATAAQLWGQRILRSTPRATSSSPTSAICQFVG